MAINPIAPEIDTYEFGGMGRRGPEPIVVTAPQTTSKPKGKKKKESSAPIAVSYDGGQTWITPEQENQPLESTDGGKTWTPVGAKPMDQGPLESLDGGQTWTPVSSSGLAPAAKRPAPGYDVNRGLQIVDALMQQYPGMNPDDAAAVAGNFLYESYGLPNIYEGQNPSNAGTFAPETGGFGIAQWTGPRRQALMQMPNPEELDTQIEYFAQENAGPEASAWQQVLSAPDLAAKTETFAREWERPGVPAIARRVDLANQISNAFYNRNTEEMQRQAALMSQPVQMIPVPVRADENLQYNLMIPQGRTR